MCGRFSIITHPELLEKRFGASFDGDFSPAGQAFPSQKLPVITSQNPDKISLFHWGLHPAWLDKISQTKKDLINVRFETLRDKRTFQKELREHRCLVLANGFYEWKKSPRKSAPYYIYLKDKVPFAFAGIWQPDEKTKLNRFAIITTPPNSLVAPIHNRMPLILSQKYEHAWTESDFNANLLEKLSKPFSDKLMRIRQLA